jgi:hypothetical protein
MEMAGKQFSPFMEMVVQPKSYSLCHNVLRLMEMAGKQFSPFMEMVLEMVQTKISGYIKS